MKAVLDTNVLIDFLRGVERARLEIDRYDSPGVSIVTWMEVLLGAKGDAEERILRDFLHRFEVLAVTGPVAERAIRLRREHRLRLPDAIIWATAQVHDRILVTRNTRDFPAGDPGVRAPYRA